MLGKNEDAACPIFQSVEVGLGAVNQYKLNCAVAAVCENRTSSGGEMKKSYSLA